MNWGKHNIRLQINRRNIGNQNSENGLFNGYLFLKIIIFSEYHRNGYRMDDGIMVVYWKYSPWYGVPEFGSREANPDNLKDCHTAARR